MGREPIFSEIQGMCQSNWQTQEMIHFSAKHHILGWLLWLKNNYKPDPRPENVQKMFCPLREMIQAQGDSECHQVQESPELFDLEGQTGSQEFRYL